MATCVAKRPAGTGANAPCPAHRPHQGTAHTAALRRGADADAEQRAVPPPHLGRHVQTGAADHLPTRFGHQRQVLAACGRVVVGRARLPNFFACEWQLHQTRVNLGVAHDAGQVDRIAHAGTAQGDGGIVHGAFAAVLQRSIFPRAVIIAPQACVILSRILSGILSGIRHAYCEPSTPGLHSFSSPSRRTTSLPLDSRQAVPKGFQRGIVTERPPGLASDTAFKPTHHTGKTP